MSNIKHNVFGAVEIHQFRIEGGPTFDLSIYLQPSSQDVLSAYLYAPASPNLHRQPAGTRKVFNFGYWGPLAGAPYRTKGLFEWLKDCGVKNHHHEIAYAVSDIIVDAWVSMTGDERAEILLSYRAAEYLPGKMPEHARLTREVMLKLRTDIHEIHAEEWRETEARYQADQEAEREAELRYQLERIGGDPDWTVDDDTLPPEQRDG